jgi:glycosyltransferase involved in cell wall biosynthesis
MNLIILNDFGYVDGGASKVALSSARALAERGHRVLLFCGVGPITESLQTVPGLSVQCLDIKEIASDPNRLRAVAHGLWNSRAADAFREATVGWSPDETVVHVHTWTKALSSSVVRAALDAGYPTVLTMHDYFSVCPTGSFFIYPTQSLCTLRPMSATCICTQCDSRGYGYKLWRVGRQWMQEHQGHVPSGLLDFISVSDTSEALMRPYLPSQASFHRVANPVTLTAEKQATPHLHEIFSFVGRLSPEKGGRLVAEAASRSGLRVRFVGDGIEREMLGAVLPDAEFTGWLPEGAAMEAMRQSRALVLPSLWYETQGLVVTEAAAMGLPAIVSSESAAREWVEDGITGLLFRHGDAHDLADKMTFLAQNPDVAMRMGISAGLRYWQNPSTAERHCEQLEGVYKKMLANKARKLYSQ